MTAREYLEYAHHICDVDRACVTVKVTGVFDPFTRALGLTDGLAGPIADPSRR